MGVARYDRDGKRIQSLELEGRLADFPGLLDHPQECNWYMCFHPRKPLMLRFCYFMEPAGVEAKGGPDPHQARTGEPLAQRSGRPRLDTGHAAGLGWYPQLPSGWIGEDLGAARLVLLLAAVGCFGCGVRIARCRRTYVAGLVVVVAATGTFLFAVFIHGELWIAEVIPLPNAIVLGNLLPLAAAFLIGILGEQHRVPLWRRGVLILVLATSAAYTLASSVPSSDTRTRHLWSLDGVSLQTAPASCSACAAATLLADYGIVTNEEEMARLCLSKSNGTPILGLYRGLKQKTRDTPWDVEVVRCGFEELCTVPPPVLLPVDVGQTTVIVSGGKGARLEPVSGTSHTVVLFGFTPDGRAEIGDPSRAWDQGRIFWSMADLQAAYRGEGLRLVGR
jgi:hypothetical protein